MDYDDDDNELKEIQPNFKERMMFGKEFKKKYNKMTYLYHPST